MDSAAIGRPGRQLALVASAQVLAMCTWFAASAVAPQLRVEWDLSGWQATVLTTAVQLGFVLGALTSAALNLADRIHPPALISGCAVVAAATTALLGFGANGFGSALTLRIITGIALAGIYPVGLKLASSWFLERRGMALSAVVGALTLGSTLPMFIGGALGDAWRSVLLVAAGLSLIAAALILLARVGPHVAPATGLQPRAVIELFVNREPRLASLGYWGHMWELYALWAWLPTFLIASSTAAGDPLSARAAGVLGFASLGICGVAGCMLAGWTGDRFGRARTATVAMTVSGCCCLLAAMLYGAPLLVLIPVLLVWGAAVIADSAMFSACTTSVVDPRYVGTALTFQTAIGFTITALTIQGLPLLADEFGWRWAIAALGIGPLAGALAMRRLSLTD